MHGAAVLQLTQQEQLWPILPRHCISAPWTPPIVQATKNAVFIIGTLNRGYVGIGAAAGGYIDTGYVGIGYGRCAC